MKYMVINVVTRCKVEVEATCPAHAVNQTPWLWEITECHLIGGENGSAMEGNSIKGPAGIDYAPK
jgi:hypothetical protein